MSVALSADGSVAMAIVQMESRWPLAVVDFSRSAPVAELLTIGARPRQVLMHPDGRRAVVLGAIDGLYII